jgi:hypothetical protein
MRENRLIQQMAEGPLVMLLLKILIHSFGFDTCVSVFMDKLAPSNA